MNVIERAFLDETIRQIKAGDAVVHLPGRVDVYGVAVHGPVHTPRAAAVAVLAEAGLLPAGVS